LPYVQPTLQTTEQTFDFRTAIGRLAKYWWVFTITLAIALSATWLYLRYATAIYYTEATILLRDQNADKRLLENLLEDLQGMGSSAQNLDNEMAILGSTAVLREAVDSLNWEASIYLEANIRTAELYRRGPLQVEADDVDPEYMLRPIALERAGASVAAGYRLKMGEPARYFSPGATAFVAVREGAVPPVLRFGQTYTLGSGNFRCSWDPAGERIVSKSVLLLIVFNDPAKLTEGVKKRLHLEPREGKGTLVAISSRGPVIEKEVDLLNQLVRIYIRRGLEEKNGQAQATLDFINAQLNAITSSLRSAEAELKSFRTQNRVMDLSASAAATFSRLNELETERAGLDIRSKYYDYLLEYVRRNRDIKQIVAPSAIGIEDELLQSLIARLSALYSEKSTLAISARDNNPAITSLSDRIVVARGELEENVRNIIKSADITRQELDRRIGLAQSQIARLPETERTLVNIQRRFTLNDNLYTYLMQKQAEAGMARAANTTDTRFLEPATVRDAVRIAPQPGMLYLLAVLLGLALPALVLLSAELLNTRIRSRQELERLSPIPILGNVGHAEQDNGELVVQRHLKSPITEAFRTLRLDLNYLAPEGLGKTGGEALVVGITSSVSGEGKTFTAMNLSAVSAMAGKKTLLILSDMRKPRTDTLLSPTPGPGLSAYLSSQATLEAIIRPSSVLGLDLVEPGVPPPNPAELIGAVAMDALLEHARLNYDLVVIDTPPLGLVSDFLQISDRCNVCLYLVRHNYSRRNYLIRINQYYREARIPGMTLVINDVAATTGYGYSYGYGYGYNYGREDAYFEPVSKKVNPLLALFKKRK
jgi:tyrosine-protein kinase Etk/Wzc